MAVAVGAVEAFEQHVVDRTDATNSDMMDMVLLAGVSHHRKAVARNVSCTPNRSRFIQALKESFHCRSPLPVGVHTLHVLIHPTYPGNQVLYSLPTRRQPSLSQCRCSPCLRAVPRPSDRAGVG
jgi:hypothetical protein